MPVTFLRLFLILLFYGLFSTRAFAAITIEITQGVEGAIPVSVVSFDTTSLPIELKEDIASIVTQDLNRSGVFRVLDEQRYPQKPHYSTEVNYAQWRDLKQELLVIGRILQPETGKLDVQFQLLDVLKKKQLLGYRFPVRLRNLRSTAHEISDLIYEKITGVPGAFNTRIAYVSASRSRSRHYVLQVADSDGFNPQTVLESDKPLMSPSWSPDGESLAYVSFENDRPEIFIQHLASAQRSKISGFKGINGAPSWSPDGKTLALVLSKDSSADIYTMDIESKKLKRLTTHRGIDTEPVWLPDGKTIVFTSNRSGSPQLYQVAAGGGTAKRVTFEGNYNAAADPSFDGRNLVMVFAEQGSYKIASVDLENDNLEILTDGNLDESPSFSPNGKMVLYASTQDNKGVLYMVALDNRIKFKLSDQEGDIREPVWGPYKVKRLK